MINQKKLKNYLSEIEINTSNAKVLGKRKKNEETRLQVITSFKSNKFQSTFLIFCTKGSKKCKKM